MGYFGAKKVSIGDFEVVDLKGQIWGVLVGNWLGIELVG
jgi:hypothetical protein